MKQKIEIIDTTLRDGLQSPLWDDFEKFYPTTREKLLLVESLAKYGIRSIEVFSPIVSKREEEDLVAILAKRDQLRKELNKPLNIFVHVRCHPKDVELALKYKVDGLNFYIGTSEQARSSNHGKSLDEISKLARDILGDVRKSNPDLAIRFSGEDAFRTPVKDLFEVYDCLVDLVDRFGLPDTVGAAIPETVKERVTALKKRYPKVVLEGHFHNDRGLALVNTLTAIKAGMDCVSTSVLGLAERSGMTSLTALLFNQYLDDPELVSDYDISSSYSLNVLMAGILKIQVPACEPISLTNRTHSAGVHTGAVLKNPSVYEGYGLESFGVTERRLLLGPLSGKHVIKYYLTEVLNYLRVTDEIAEEIIAEFKVKAPHLKKRQTPTSLLEQLAEQHKLSRKDKPVAHIEVLEEQQPLKTIERYNEEKRMGKLTKLDNPKDLFKDEG